MNTPKYIDKTGSAFPCTGEIIAFQDGEPQFGMTLRDYFAAAALTGLIGDLMKSAASNKQNAHETKVYLAQGCYAVADAMIEARKEGV